MMSRVSELGGPPSRLRACLHHLMLGSPEPERLADFYVEALGYAASGAAR